MSVERRRMLMATAGEVIPTKGVYILYVDGRVSNYDTLITGETPVGVILKNEYVSIVIHPSEDSEKTWSPRRTVISGVTTVLGIDAAKTDYTGFTNTNAAIASGFAGTAFTFARDVSYADGRQGYLPACGEMEQMRLNETNINIALDLIGGTQLGFGSYYYWSSTQRNDYGAWGWNYPYSSWANMTKSSHYSCRSVATYE